MYTYFVVYAYDKGFGRSELSLNNMVSSSEDIILLETAIQNRTGIQDVVVINYILLPNSEKNE